MAGPSCPPLAFALLLQLLVRPDSGGAQQPSSWRQQIRWENHGRLYSLFNSASRFLPPRGSGGQNLYLTAHPGPSGLPAAPRLPGSFVTVRRVALGSGAAPASRAPEGRAALSGDGEGSGGAGAPSWQGSAGRSPAGRPEVPAQGSTPDGTRDAAWEGLATSGARGTRGNATAGAHREQRLPGSEASGRRAEEALRAREGDRSPAWPNHGGGNEIEGAPVPPRSSVDRGNLRNAEDDPRRNSLFYNLYPNARQRVRAPGTNWRPGYGTRNFHNGE